MLLNIDTATETASIALSNGLQVVDMLVNEDQKDHAAWIHDAIKKMMQQASKQLSHLKAIAVTAGPGSYTGLRVGMSTAKGLCYALNIPLITESTLKVMAQAALSQAEGDHLLCPMIDARRMEVFTAGYDRDLTEVMKPQPLVLDESSFAELLTQSKLLFFGSGSGKFKSILQHSNASFAHVRHHAGHLAVLANTSFETANFTDAAYADPVYLKEFYTHTKK